MKRLVALMTCVALAASCSSSDRNAHAGAATTTDDLVDIGQGLKGRAGSAATVVATGLTHAATFAFDGSGRLWVATADYSDSGQDAVSVVAAGITTTVISGLHTPLGLLWIGDMLYVASEENVATYAGFDGTTFASHSTVVQFPAGVGEVNGLALSPDGRVELGISAPCDHCTPTNEYSGTIVSFLPDGTDLRVDARGMRAPIALTHHPVTHDLFVTMNQRDDLDDTPGDWLAVVPEGSAWGFPDCYGQGGDACTGVPNPVAELDQHAAVSGLAIVGDLAVAAEWATGIVQGVTLTSTNGTYTGTVSPFVTGLKNPVAVALGPDAAIYVGDWTTGTIYRITTN